MVEIFDLLQGAPALTPAAPLSLAMGNFDGVHLGHRALISEAVAAANEMGLLPAVWTFDRNPSGAPEISTPSEKAELCAALGVRYLIRCPFDGVRGTEAADFVNELLIGRLKVRAAVCGFNHRFGKNGAGDSDLLRRLMTESGGVCRVIEPVYYGGEPVSSSRIRSALAEGGVESANAMLGRRFSLSGEVTHGNEIGRTLGFPTVNIPVSAGAARLLSGVFVTRCMGLPAVSNVGSRPTVTDSSEIVCETHIIGYGGDLYGRTLKVEFLSRIRPEIKFASLDGLIAQLKSDVDFAINFKE
ncbi:MAG: riboflavin biosynthesis protein RibF [Clostridia bacterium]|nr:riboflavin biosynthesis protein RibF [Clostridia bacterium]